MLSTLATGDDRNRLFHVNLLKKWKEQMEMSFSACFSEAEDIDGFETPYHPQPEATETWKDVHVNEDLSDEQKQDVEKLLKQYQNIFTGLPGHTSVIKHDITIMEGTVAIRQRPYCVPESQKAGVKKEIDWRLAQGIIQPSKSPWASLLVIVKKRYGKLCLCVDYRKLNQVTSFDSYPMLRADDVLAKKGQSMYISTLDLTKGY